MNPLQVLKKYWRLQQHFNKVSKREIAAMIRKESVLTVRAIFSKKE